MEPVKIFIVDDHAVIRKGLKAVFSGLPQYKVVGEAEDGSKALQGVASAKPDIILMDITMPGFDGLLVTRRIIKECPGTKVIMFTMHQRSQYVLDSLKAGARGYVLKGGGVEEIIEAVKKVHDGGRYVSPALSEALIDGFVDRAKDGEEAYNPFDSLSLREREIVKLITDGATSREIAEKLFLSEGTVKTYRVDIMKKLNVKEIAGLIKLAYQCGVVRPD